MDRWMFVKAITITSVEQDKDLFDYHKQRQSDNKFKVDEWLPAKQQVVSIKFALLLGFVKRNITKFRKWLA